MKRPSIFPAIGALALVLSGHAAGAADAVEGERVYESRCIGCHSLDANRIGPMHRGVFGRKAGSVTGFAYSPALKNAAIIWTEETLDRWLTDPQKLIPGQRMNFRVADPELRAHVIAYLKRESAR
ncbi:MAG: c-type cytochrome [Alphaproteobacteria bacterium]|nr:c-type cytochrome [Alphaproteobacteria bacterium]